MRWLAAHEANFDFNFPVRCVLGPDPHTARNQRRNQQRNQKGIPSSMYIAVWKQYFTGVPCDDGKIDIAALDAQLLHAVAIAGFFPVDRFGFTGRSHNSMTHPCARLRLDYRAARQAVHRKCRRPCCGVHDRRDFLATYRLWMAAGDPRLIKLGIGGRRGWKGGRGGGGCQVRARLTH